MKPNKYLMRITTIKRPKELAERMKAIKKAVEEDNDASFAAAILKFCIQDGHITVNDGGGFLDMLHSCQHHGCVKNDIWPDVIALEELLKGLNDEQERTMTSPDYKHGWDGGFIAGFAAAENDLTAETVRVEKAKAEAAGYRAALEEIAVIVGSREGEYLREYADPIITHSTLGKIDKAVNDALENARDGEHDER